MAINFIKNLSQLITGGIGIVDDELVYKDSEGNVKTTATDFEAVEEIPESLDPGQIVFVTETGSLWVGASDDYFPTLDEGEPWPLRGYKYSAFNVTQEGTDAPVLTAFVNEIGSFSTTREDPGGYFINLPSGVDADDVGVFPITGSGDNTDLGVVLNRGNNRVIIETKEVGSGMDGILNGFGLTLEVKQFPPQPE